MFVLTGEGERWRNKGTWTMHAVLGVYESKREARDFVKTLDPLEEDIYLITNLDDLKDRERV